MHTAAVARYLHAQGLVTFDEFGADCFLEEAPAEPVDAVTLVSRPGGESDVSMGYDSPEFQVIVRSSGDGGVAREGYERAVDIRDELHGLSHVTLGAGTEDETRVLWIIAKQSAPVSLGKDKAGRHRWSIAYRSEVGQLAVT